MSLTLTAALDAALKSIISEAVGEAFLRHFPEGVPAAAAPKKAAAKKAVTLDAEAVAPTAPAEPIVAAVAAPAPLPAPATPPAQVKGGDVDADRAKLLALTAKIEGGRQLATELIRAKGPKFDGLNVADRAEVLAQLEKLAA